jgi:E1A-binding protein p400
MDAAHPWGIMDEWFVMQVIQQMQELPSNLVVVSPGHTPNWDLVSDIVSTGTHFFRSSRICRHHYESIILPREEGKIIPPGSENTQPKKKKKQLSAAGVPLPTPPTPPKVKTPRTKHLFNRDENKSFIQTCATRNETMREMSRKRPDVSKPTFTGGAVSNKPNPKHIALLQDLGIGYESPLLPTQIATNRQDRIAKEKAKQQAEHLARQKQALLTAKQQQFQRQQLLQQQAQNQQAIQQQSLQQQQSHVPQGGSSVTVHPGSNVAQLTAIPQQQPQSSIRMPAPGYQAATQMMQQQPIPSSVRPSQVPSISVSTPVTPSVQSSIPEVEQLARALSQAAANFESQTQQQQVAAAAAQQQLLQQQQPQLIQNVPQQNPRPQQIQAQVVSQGQVFNIAVQGQPMQVQQRFVGPAVSASVRPVPANATQQQLQQQQIKRQVLARQQMQQLAQLQSQQQTGGQAQQIQLQQQVQQQNQPLPQITQLTGQRLQFPGTISQQINVQQVSGSPMTVTSTPTVTPTAAIVSVSQTMSSPVLTKTLVSGPQSVQSIPVPTQSIQQQTQPQLVTRTMTVTGSPAGSASTLQVTPGQRILTQGRTTQTGQVIRTASGADIEAILRQQGMQIRTAPQNQQQSQGQPQSKPQILQIQLVPIQQQQSQGQAQQPQQILGIQSSSQGQTQQVTKTMTVTGTGTPTGTVSTLHVSPATTRIVTRTPGQSQVVQRTVTEAELQALTGQRQIQFPANISGQINVQPVSGGSSGTPATSGSSVVSAAAVSASPVLTQTLVSGAAATQLQQQQALQHQQTQQLITRTMTVTGTSGSGPSSGSTISAIQVTPAGISQGQKIFAATTAARGQPQAFMRTVTEAELKQLFRNSNIQLQNPSQQQPQQVQGQPRQTQMIQLQNLPPQQQQMLANLAQQQMLQQQHQGQQQSMQQQHSHQQPTIQLQASQIPANIALVRVSSSSVTSASSSTSSTTVQSSPQIQLQNQPQQPQNPGNSQ